jgi:site-specific recombinase XerD
VHITPYLGGQRLDRLQPEHLEQLYNALIEKGLSPTSVLRVHRIISRALKVAMQCQRIHRNVATLVDPPAQRRSEVATALTIEEATAVLLVTEASRHQAQLRSIQTESGHARDADSRRRIVTSERGPEANRSERDQQGHHGD